MVQRVSIWVYSMLFSWLSWRHRLYLLMLVCLLLVTTSLAGAAGEVRRFDHNKDGKPDQWEHYRDGMLLRVEVDRNRDGRVDEWTFYEDGKPVRAEFDTDGDGRVNQREFYNAQKQIEQVGVDRDGDGRMEQRLFYGPGKTLLRAEVDADGAVDRIIYYEGLGQIAQIWENLDPAGQPRTRLIYEAGKLTRGEFDTTGNGQVNQWLSYDADGQVIRAEYDQHAKGRPDQWEYFTPGSKEPYKVERDTNGDGKADTVWEKGASASAKPR